MAISESSGAGEITGINITPLVDVCLVLVIIFMVTAPLLLQPSLPVQLPKAKTAAGKDKQNVTITITKDGQWALDDQTMSFAEVASALKGRIAENADRFVVIRADRDARHGLALKAMKAAKEAGAKSISIATEQKIEKPVAAAGGA